MIVVIKDGRMIEISILKLAKSVYAIKLESQLLGKIFKTKNKWSSTPLNEQTISGFATKLDATRYILTYMST